MKNRLTILVLVLALSGCGGDDGSAPSSSTSATTSSGIATTGSPVYTSALQAFAETNLGIQLLIAADDLVVIAGNTGNCPRGGTIGYVAPIETLKLCQRTYPDNEAYSGTFSATVNQSGTTSNVVTTAVNVQGYDPTNTTRLVFTFASGAFVGSDTDNGTNDQTLLTSGSILVNAGSSSTYTIGQFGSLTTNNGTSLVLQQNATAAKLLQVVKGINTYDVTSTQAMTMVGNNFTSGGNITITYTTSVGCSPIAVTFLPANQFTLACGGQSITKNWTDADVVAARNAATL